MKNRGFDAFADLVIGSAGSCAFALAVSFGLFTRGDAHVLGLHSVLLALVGVGLMVAGASLRRASGRIAVLEDQIMANRRGND